MILNVDNNGRRKPSLIFAPKPVEEFYQMCAHVFLYDRHMHVQRKRAYEGIRIQNVGQFKVIVPNYVRIIGLSLWISITLISHILLTVKAATLIFISGCGSAISSAKEGKSGFIYNFVKLI